MKRSLGCIAMVALLPFFGGCTPHRFVHWEDNFDEATRRTTELTRDRDAEITLTTGERIKARSLTFKAGSLSWTPVISGEPSTLQTMPLADIDGITVVSGSHGGLGAAIGAISGALYVGLRCATDLICDQGYESISVAYGALHAVLGAFFGLAVGAAIPKWVHFAP